MQCGQKKKASSLDLQVLGPFGASAERGYSVNLSKTKSSLQSLDISTIRQQLNGGFQDCNFRLRFLHSAYPPPLSRPICIHAWLLSLVPQFPHCSLIPLCKALAGLGMKHAALFLKMWGLLRERLCSCSSRGLHTPQLWPCATSSHCRVSLFLPGTEQEARFACGPNHI